MRAHASTRAHTDVAPSENPFGDFLRDVQNAHGFDRVSELVRFVGVDPSSMWRYLNGETEPTIGNLRKIAKATGRTLGDLMVVAGIAEPEELGVTAQPKRRMAKVLHDAQDYLDDERTTPRLQQALLRRIRFDLHEALDFRDGVPMDIVDAERRR